MTAESEQNPEAGLTHDLEAGLRFLHALGMQSKVDLIHQGEWLFALVEELVAAGLLDLRSFEARRARVAEREAERMTRDGHVRVLVDETEDKYALTDLPEIDCAERLHLCQARCCTLTFPLSFQDLDERLVRWNYGAPYQIRQRPDGWCVHNQPDSHTCAVYDQRPAICRTYDCRQDARIWADFDARIPAMPAPEG